METKKWVREVKLEIEDRNFWHYVQCCHCETIFLVEESIDNNWTMNKHSTFKAFCPRCATVNTQASDRRLKLKVDRLAEKGEYDPLTTRLAKNLVIEGLDNEEG